MSTRISSRLVNFDYCLNSKDNKELLLSNSEKLQISKVQRLNKLETGTLNKLLITSYYKL